MWTIYSIGDFALLLEILNAIAALTAPGGALGLGLLVGTGFIVGIFLIVFRAIVSGRLELQYLLVGWIGYMLLFGVRVDTTNVEDVYTGASFPVDNLPIGIAALGGVISGVGHQLTAAFEAAFTTPTLTNSGYLESLNILMLLRDQGAGPANSQAQAGTPSYTGDVEKSVVNYIKDCVIYDIEMALPTQEVTRESLQMSPNLLAAMRVNSSVWTTVTYIPGEDPDSGRVRTCSAAYTELSTYLNDDFLPAWNNYLAEVSGIADPAASIDLALESIVAAGLDQQHYMLGAFLSRLIRQGDMGRSVELGSTAAVLLKSQAMEQRRVQWSAEQTMFLEVARPLMAFVEAFSYAITPIMAFLIVLGPMGISLLGKYVLVMIWIQLWTPVLAICNLYINMAAMSKLSGLHSVVEVTSMRGLDNLYTEVGSYLATGGMLASATPLISLLILSGSLYAFTSLAQRMQGGDHVNEKTLAPDVRNTPPMLNMASPHVQDQTAGIHHSGQQRIATQLRLGHQIGNDDQSLSEQMYQAQNSFGELYAKAVAAKLSSAEGGRHSETLGLQTSASGSRVNQVVDSAINRNFERFDLNESQTRDLKTAINARMSGDAALSTQAFGRLANSVAGRVSSTRSQKLSRGSTIQSTAADSSEHSTGTADIGKVGGGVQASANITGSESSAEQQTDAIGRAFENLVTGNKTFRSEFLKSRALDVRDGNDTSYLDSDEIAQNAELREAANSVFTTAERYSNVQRESRSISADVTFNTIDFSEQVKNMDSRNGDQALAGKLFRLTQEHDLQNDKGVGRHLGSSEMQGLSGGKKTIAAMGLALFYGSPESRIDLAKFMSEDLGTGTATEFGDAKQNANIIEDQSKVDKTRQDVLAGVGPRVDMDKVTKDINDSVTDLKGKTDGLEKKGLSLVEQHYNDESGKLTARLQGLHEKGNKTIKPALDELMQNTADRWFPSPDQISNFIPNQAEAVTLWAKGVVGAPAYQARAVESLKNTYDENGNSEWDKMSVIEQLQFRGASLMAGWNHEADEHFNEQKAVADQYLNPIEAEYYALSDTRYSGSRAEQADARLQQLREQIDDPKRVESIEYAISTGDPKDLRPLALSDKDSALLKKQAQFEFDSIKQAGDKPNSD